MRILMVQLSDIHLKERNENLKEKFIGIAKACISLIKKDTKIIFVLSGDIAYSGTSEEYEIFSEYFNNTKQIINEEQKVEMFTVCVPGNHDCFFTEEEKSEEECVRNLIIDKLNTQIDKPVSKDCFNKLLSSQINFDNFKREFSLDLLVN